MKSEFISPDEALRFVALGGALLDVRAEIEFEQASIPAAKNIPLLTTSERALVGKLYRTDGQAAAVSLGHDLVGGETRAKRVDAWKTAICESDIPALYCARGGLRSAISQSWLAEQNCQLPRICGGYKALRRQLLDELQRCSMQNFLLVSGRTGGGKTRFLDRVRPMVPAVDLERCANHRGSAFGWLPGGQPAQATFENAIAVELMRATQTDSDWTLVESESSWIGKLQVPSVFFAHMVRSPAIVLEIEKSIRVENLLNEYVLDSIQDERESSVVWLEEQLLRSLSGIAKRFGSARLDHCRRLIQDACAETKRSGDVELHRRWIEYLLDEYYDPLYDKYRHDGDRRVCCSGDAMVLEEFVRELSKTPKQRFIEIHG